MTRIFVNPADRKLPCLTISLETEIAEDFKVYCWQNKTTVSKIVRDYIIKILNKQGKKKYESK